jgi:plastocyanin
VTRVVVVSKKQIRTWAIVAGATVVIVGAAWIWGHSGTGLSGMSKSASGTMVQPGPARTIHMVTGEFKTTGADGKPIEAYRWDPGTIYVKKGETINLSIYGVNGTSHPFVIDGLNVRGEVKKGKDTVVTFRADQPGTYRIVCLTHPDIAHNGPMVGYIVVDT